MTDHETCVRLAITGVVQGVGFRPFIHRLATELGLHGHVGNDVSGVFIELRGPARSIDSFVSRIDTDAPPLARVDRVERCASTADVGNGFHIVDSESGSGERSLVPPDTAPCSDCLREMRDPSNRRFAHPFITCTNCGPRFTIITGLPYDRDATTMASFDMCEACRREYTDATNRRYHAQPVACNDCGPTLRFTSSSSPHDPNALNAAVEVIGASGTVALKGVGGFQLVCDATDDAAVATLRDRKMRPDKPFAVMVRDIEAADELAELSDSERAQLTSVARPIVLAGARLGNSLSTLVAPASRVVGVMLPSSPLHHLLLDRVDVPLVMTSGNVSGEPIVYADRDMQRLAHLCDGFLTHDRSIQVPCDDSVVRVAGNRLLPVRRARGFAPMPIPFVETQRSVLAVGGELKNAFCLATSQHAWMSQHIGDMENLATIEAFEHSVESLVALTGVEPDIVAVDAHPGYLTSKWARTHHPGRVVEVQHHHAHIAAVMAENECDPHQPVLGFAFDGTGYGDDGTIWGGEVMLASVDSYQRIGHLAPIPLPGGDAAIKNPARVALSHLRSAGIDWADDLAPVQHLTEHERQLLAQQLDRSVACVPTTSMGRLFDGVAALLGLRQVVSFEAQAAIDLEAAALQAQVRQRRYQFGLLDGTIEHRPVLAALVSDLRSAVPVEDIAWAFHQAVADVVVSITIQSSEAAPVALSGGVFQNALLTELCVDGLAEQGRVALTHHLVPPNDGGLALGQAFVAAHRTVSDQPTGVVHALPTETVPALPTSYTLEP